MSSHRQHYYSYTRDVYWTPLRVMFALTYLAAFVTLYFVL